MKILNSVKILKYDNCYTYMLKRVSIYELYREIESTDFIEKFTHYKIPSDFSGINIGDILVSYRTDNACKMWNNREILEDGKMITHYVEFRTHFMCFEGEFISDLTYDVDGFNSIRLRRTNTFTNFDDNDFYLKLSEICTTKLN